MILHTFIGSHSALSNNFARRKLKIRLSPKYFLGFACDCILNPQGFENIEIRDSKLNEINCSGFLLILLIESAVHKIFAGGHGHSHFPSQETVVAVEVSYKKTFPFRN